MGSTCIHGESLGVDVMEERSRGSSYSHLAPPDVTELGGQDVVEQGVVCHVVL